VGTHREDIKTVADDQFLPSKRASKEFADPELLANSYQLCGDHHTVVCHHRREDVGLTQARTDPL
jgi:hypothetical protein